MEQKKASTKFLVVSLVFLMVLAAISITIPSTSAAGLITLNPLSGAPGSSVIVTGTGFTPNAAVAIAFGAEVPVAHEALPPPGSGLGPHTLTVASKPIKPGTFVLNIDVNSGLQNSNVTDNGNGVLSSTAASFASGTINYATGLVVYYTNMDPSLYTVVRKAFYTTYQNNLTPATSITTSASGIFSTNITVPTVNNGTYTVTAIDTSGNRASNNEFGVIPEGFSVGLIAALSSVAVLVCTLCKRRQPKITN